MNYFKLACNEENIIEKINRAEKEERFNDHLDPVTADGCLEVNENFPFIPGPFLSFKWWLERKFFLNFFTRILNRNVFHTKVQGRKNLKGIKGAVFVCNHVNKFDALIYDYALRFRKTKIMVAEFNNRPGLLGEMMRADGIMPFKNEKRCIIKFAQAVKHYLKKGKAVLFFPEGSEWFCYKKPRPMAKGAFHFAVESDVPVVPLFITFKNSPSSDSMENIDSNICVKKDKNGILYPGNVTFHILKPVYPDSSLSRSDNVQFMMKKAFEEWEEQYRDSYEK